MKMLWCWRCRMEVPMLDEEESRQAGELYSAGIRNDAGGIDRQTRFRELLDYYYEMTGWRETEPNAIMHHDINLYGPPCEQCGKPYRTSKASFCAACGHKRPAKFKPLVISFDLDDTLIPGMIQFDTEPRRWLQRIMGVEKIRKGTKKLIDKLQHEGHSVYIYTTSLRPANRIQRTLRSYGIRVDQIINRTIHEKQLKNRQNLCSKYPPAFGIDVHIDDSEGVGREGQQHRFNTIILSPVVPDWKLFILTSIATYAYEF
ncbi:MAG: hypothetical protein J7621_22255 [Niastella sp.]|nr:hypothetical protein [Niastella sp.]